MGKLILISGPNDSGKSRFAEQWAAQQPGPRIYIATMEPASPENYARIEKHRRQRAGLGFETRELPGPVGAAPLPEDSVVLLEDLSNLLANALFGQGRGEQAVWEDLLLLQSRCRLLLVVTIAGLSAGEYQGETAAYIHALNRLNQRLAQRADAAAEMADGRPFWQKGDPDGLV